MTSNFKTFYFKGWPGKRKRKIILVLIKKLICGIDQFPFQVPSSHDPSGWVDWPEFCGWCPLVLIPKKKNTNILLLLCHVALHNRHASRVNNCRNSIWAFLYACFRRRQSPHASLETPSIGGFYLFKFFENDLDDYDVYPVTTIATDSLTALIVYFFASTFYKPASSSFPDSGREEVFLFCC